MNRTGAAACRMGGVEYAGVDEETFMNGLDELSELAFDDQCTGANPRYPLIKEIKELYKAILERANYNE